MNDIIRGVLSGYALINLIAVWWYVRAVRRLPCQHRVTVRFTSLNKKWCSDCRCWLPWELKPGQKPIF